MKNVTLSADGHLIEQARLLAKSRHKTLNALFREWLEQLTAQSGGVHSFVLIGTDTRGPGSATPVLMWFQVP